MMRRRALWLIVGPLAACGTEASLGTVEEAPPAAQSPVLLYSPATGSRAPYAESRLDLTRRDVIYELDRQALRSDLVAYGPDDQLRSVLAWVERREVVLAQSDRGRPLMLNTGLRPTELPPLADDEEDCSYVCAVSSDGLVICWSVCGGRVPLLDRDEYDGWWRFFPEEWLGDGHTDPPPAELGWDPPGPGPNPPPAAGEGSAGGGSSGSGGGSSSSSSGTSSGTGVSSGSNQPPSGGCAGCF